MTTNHNRVSAEGSTTAQNDARASTKTERLLAMLRQSEGASLEEMSEALGWQQHSTRAALTGLRRKGHDVVRDKQGSVTIYRIAA